MPYWAEIIKRTSGITIETIAMEKVGVISKLYEIWKGFDIISTHKLTTPAPCVKMPGGWFGC